MSHYQRIKDLREDSDKTQTQVAEYLKTTAQYYGKYEKGEREIPFWRAVALATYYDVSLDYLAGRTNVKKMKSNIVLSHDEIKLVQQFRVLSERNKGKVELFMEQLIESQSKDTKKQR